MEVWFSPTRRIAVIRPAGEMDIGSAPPLRRALLRANQAERLILADFSAVEFVDSTTVGVLVGAWKRARQRDKGLLVAHAHGPALRVFRLLGLGDLLVDPQEPPQHLQIA